MKRVELISRNEQSTFNTLSRTERGAGGMWGGLLLPIVKERGLYTTEVKGGVYRPHITV